MRRAVRYCLESGRLSQTDSGGNAAWSLALTEVDRIVFVDFGSPRRPVRRLDLFAAGIRRRIGINASGGGAMTEDMAAFLKLAEAIVRAFAETRPETRVDLGEYGAARWALFGLAMLMLAGGVGILSAALASGVSSARLTEAAVPTSLLILLGGAIGWANRPGAPKAAVPAETLAEALRTMRGADSSGD